MRAYELMVIIDTAVDDATATAVVDRTRELIEASDGTIAKLENWGRRQLAYKINHKSDGVYVLLEISTRATNLNEVDRYLRLADEVVRHKIIRLPDREAARRGLLGEAAPPAG